MAKLKMGVNDLATINPEIAAEWHSTKNGDLQPTDFTKGSDQKVCWRCSHCGHDWQSTIANRTFGCGCPVCARKKRAVNHTKTVLEKHGSLQDNHPNLAAEWHPTKNGSLLPSQVATGSNKMVWWKCAKGHEWEAKVDNRVKGRGCPICAGRLVLPGFNDLATTHPALAAEWHPTKNGSLLPSNVTKGTHKKVWWLGPCGHEWQAKISDRSAGNGCPVCAGRMVLSGVNDLATTNPTLAAQWHPTKNGTQTPEQVPCSSSKKVWWLGTCGHEWEVSINNRNHGYGCPVCSGQQTLPGFNDLNTLRPDLAAKWHPTKNGKLSPRDLTLGAGTKVWWICEKGHEWETSVKNRTRNGSGCPICDNERKTSFAEQAIFYYFKQITPALNRYKLHGKTEIDVYLPEFRFGIEYDGYLHQTEEAQQRDARKNAVLAAAGITLVRVVEVNSLTGYEDSDSVIYCKYSSSLLYMNEVLQKLIARFDAITSRHSQVNIDIERDRAEIYNQYILMEKENSLASKNPTLAAEWHPTKNAPLLPSQVAPSSNKKVWWLCPFCGREWLASPNGRSKSSGCPNCARRRRKTHA